ncbi:MAG: hypothetical protein ACYC1Q_01525 [Bacteroidia bacterium]
MKAISLVNVTFCILLCCGCEKDLPPLRCHDLLLSYAPYAPSPDIDSVHLFIQRSDIPNGQIIDTMIHGAVASVPYNFCGVFKYRVRVYNSTPGIKYEMGLWRDGKYNMLGGPRMVNGYIDDNYEYEGQFLY